jgi:tRNA(fMet)-specific endonuclease VapC
MSFLLDTNVCIVYLNGKSPAVRERMNAEDARNLFVSSISRAELFYGAAKSIAPELTLQKQREFLERFKSISFDDSAAAAYGPIRASLARQGVPIGAHDLLISAIAISNNLTLISHNLREFQRISDLRVENWQTD